MPITIGKRLRLWTFWLHMRLLDVVWKVRHRIAQGLLKLSLWLRQLSAKADATVLNEGAGRERHPYRSVKERYRWR